MIPLALRLARRASRLTRFGRDRGGATALEFALVGVPFVGMLMAMVELGFIFLISATLDNATATAARTIRTGQLQSGAQAAASASAFQTSICTGMGWLQSTCASNLQVDVEPYANFQATNNAGASTTGGQMNTASFKFSCGAPGSIVLVRAFFVWPLIAPGFDKALQKLNTGQTVITSTATFKNEPYTPGGAPAC